MVEHKCERCGYKTPLKSNLRGHLERKNPCETRFSERLVTELLAELNEMPVQVMAGGEKHKCPHCSRGHNTRQALYQHKKICSVRPLETSVGGGSNVSLDDLCRIIATSIKNGGYGTHIQTQNNIQTQNIQQNIVINNYGQERIDHLTDSLLTSYLLNPSEGVVNLFKTIHYNDEVPENKNIRNKSITNNQLQTWDNGKWITVDKNNTLDAAIKSNTRLLHSHFQKVKTTMDDGIGDTLLQFFLKMQSNDGPQFYRVRRDVYALVVSDGSAPLYLQVVDDPDMYAPHPL